MIMISTILFALGASNISFAMTVGRDRIQRPYSLRPSTKRASNDIEIAQKKAFKSFKQIPLSLDKVLEAKHIQKNAFACPKDSRGFLMKMKDIVENDEVTTLAELFDVMPESFINEKYVAFSPIGQAVTTYCYVEKGWLLSVKLGAYVDYRTCTNNAGPKCRAFWYKMILVD